MYYTSYARSGYARSGCNNDPSENNLRIHNPGGNGRVPCAKLELSGNDAKGKEVMVTSGERSAYPVQASAVERGLTVREWFAGMALQGVVTKGLDVIGDRVVSEHDRNLMIARRAYALADAMLLVAGAEA